MPQRSLAARLGWLLRDYAKRVWDNSGEDNVFFLAGGIAFNILLAAVPFFLLLATGLVYLLNQSPDTTSAVSRSPSRATSTRARSSPPAPNSRTVPPSPNTSMVGETVSS